MLEKQLQKMDLDLATCLFTGLSTECLQDKRLIWEDGHFTTATPKIFAKEVIRFVRRKELRSISSPFEISDEYFAHAFQLNKFLFQDLILVLCLRTYYRPEADTNPIPLDLRVLATLTYLAHGHFGALNHLEAFRLYQVSILQRCVPQVCQTIVHFMATDYIVFPSNNHVTSSIKLGFNSQFGIPNVVGILDCFHVRLSKVDPSHNRSFRCRHGNLAINVQVICDHTMRFLDVNPRAPGGASDISVWKRSHIHGIVKNLFKTEPAWLIADRGYKLEDILINPYRCPNSISELRLNAMLERMLGVLDTAVVMLTSRFRCLKTILPYNHQAAANIVTACATLHNYLLSKDCDIDERRMSIVPMRKPLPNAIFEDKWSAGYKNREYVKAYCFGDN
ncbi:putative nuclease HARBI1 [Anastrepha obliqua]|uniref:putative nuclease HARBI1 n=1 Tax=Anastrepha obliqua TaxID=95512 RepID=UPI0024099E21|nr:putative nuclease HARBI1 [Anastrepha obliqua]